MRDDPIKLLEHFKQRKGMYIHPVDISNVESYLHGLSAGLRLAFLDVGDWWEAGKRRGWKKHSSGFVPQMQKKKMSDAEIMDELIEITINQFKASTNLFNAYSGKHWLK